MTRPIVPNAPTKLGPPQGLKYGQLASRTSPGWSWISVSSSLLEGYDEPEILPSSSCRFCPTGAEVGQLMNRPTSAGFPSRLAVTYRAVGDLIPDPRRGADRDLVAGE